MARKGLYALKLASKQGVDRATLKLMANGLVFSHLHYCDSVLGQACPTNLGRLQRVQDRTVRVILRAEHHADVVPLRKKLGWLNLRGKRQVHLATMVYRCLNNEAPEQLQQLFVPHKQGHYHTRNNQQLAVPNLTTENGQKTMAYRGAMLWNALPRAIHTCDAARKCRLLTYNYILLLPDQIVASLIY